MKVLVIGSGPIVIGQAAEFDYAGTQACRSLREEGCEVVLINSNPATIMTDPEMADALYIEPLTPEFCERVIARERPDALLPTLGGQTGLNLATKIAELGILDKYGVKLLGTPLSAIRKAEDREEFRKLMREIREPVPESFIIETPEQLKAILDTKVPDEGGRLIDFPYPRIVRPAYTLGGTGGGIAHDPDELWEIGRKGLALSMRSQVMIERSLLGWKEIEYEVMRDGAGNCITVCNMENFDPMGVHTGDSIVVAPSQTLSDLEYHMLRTASLKIIRALGIEGGCNVQLAVNPESFDYYVIEVNPRVSRSSALASKATGYPIARVAAKIAIGKTLDQIENQVTKTTKACFEPALDYCVVKIPRWPFDKFRTGDRTLFTQMKATGEVMAIDRSFEAALLKAIRGMEVKQKDLRHPKFSGRSIGFQPTLTGSAHRPLSRRRAAESSIGFQPMQTPPASGDFLSVSAEGRSIGFQPMPTPLAGGPSSGSGDGLHRLEADATRGGLHRLEADATRGGLHRLEADATRGGLHRLEADATMGGLHRLEADATRGGLHRLEADATMGRVPEVGETAAVEKRQGGHLPHWRLEGAIYNVVFRQTDSVPKEVSRQWKEERDLLVKQIRSGALAKDEIRRLSQLQSERIDELLNAGKGSCVLNDPQCAQIVEDALLHFDGDRYLIHAWCVMPNHVHVVVEPQGELDLSSVLHSWKSFTSNEINKAIGRTGVLWQVESYDHVVRDEGDYDRCIQYVLDNPIKARLQEWKWVGSRTTGILPVGSSGREGTEAGGGGHRLEADATSESPETGEGLHRLEADATSGFPDEALREAIRIPTDERLWAVCEGLRRGWSVDEINKISRIDKWFLTKLQGLVGLEQQLVSAGLRRESKGREGIELSNLVFEAFETGFSSPTILNLMAADAEEDDFARFVRTEVQRLKVMPVFKMVDTCSAEFESATPYYYGTFEQEDDGRLAV